MLRMLQFPTAEPTHHSAPVIELTSSVPRMFAKISTVSTWAFLCRPIAEPPPTCAVTGGVSSTLAQSLDTIPDAWPTVLMATTDVQTSSMCTGVIGSSTACCVRYAGISLLIGMRSHDPTWEPMQTVYPRMEVSSSAKLIHQLPCVTTRGRERSGLVTG